MHFKGLYTADAKGDLKFDSLSQSQFLPCILIHIAGVRIYPIACSVAGNEAVASLTLGYLPLK
jgi:hypothetical protein